MNSNATLLRDMSPEQLIELFNGLQNQLGNIIENYQPKAPTEYLTRSEVAKMLKVDLSTLHHWTKKGKIKPYGIGNRVYYKRSEIETAIKPI